PPPASTLFPYTTLFRSNWMHVWVVSEDTPIPEWLRTLPNVALAVRGSDLYLRYLATASHLVNNSTFPSWFIRRPEQRYLNTWHGDRKSTRLNSSHVKIS